MKTEKSELQEASMPHPPQAGDSFRCERCGMELEITADCRCEEGVHLECCGQPMIQIRSA